MKGQDIIGQIQEMSPDRMVVLRRPYYEGKLDIEFCILLEAKGDSVHLVSPIHYQRILHLPVPDEDRCQLTQS